MHGNLKLSVCFVWCGSPKHQLFVVEIYKNVVDVLQRGTLNLDAVSISNIARRILFDENGDPMYEEVVGPVGIVDTVIVAGPELTKAKRTHMGMCRRCCRISNDLA